MEVIRDAIAEAALGADAQDRLLAGRDHAAMDLGEQGAALLAAERVPVRGQGTQLGLGRVEEPRGIGFPRGDRAFVENRLCPGRGSDRNQQCGGKCRGQAGVGGLR